MDKKYLQHTKYSLLTLFVTFYIAMTGSAIAQESVPPPMALTPQEFCRGSNAIVANLKAKGSNIVWYDKTGALLSAETPLVTGVYSAAQRIGDRESPVRTAVDVIVRDNILPPVALTPQVICSDNASIANLKAKGGNIVWYDQAEGGAPLPAETPLTTGTYYAVERIGNCESARTPVEVERVEGPC